jgi:hypothetical protein
VVGSSFNIVPVANSQSRLLSVYGSSGTPVGVKISGVTQSSCPPLIWCNYSALGNQPLQVSGASAGHGLNFTVTDFTPCPRVTRGTLQGGARLLSDVSGGATDNSFGDSYHQNPSSGRYYGLASDYHQNVFPGFSGSMVPSPTAAGVSTATALMSAFAEVAQKRSVQYYDAAWDVKPATFDTISDYAKSHPIEPLKDNGFRHLVERFPESLETLVDLLGDEELAKRTDIFWHHINAIEKRLAEHVAGRDPGAPLDMSRILPEFEVQMLLKYRTHRYSELLLSCVSTDVLSAKAQGMSLDLNRTLLEGTWLEGEGRLDEIEARFARDSLEELTEYFDELKAELSPTMVQSTYKALSEGVYSVCSWAASWFGGAAVSTEDEPSASQTAMPFHEAGADGAQPALVTRSLRGGGDWY